MKSHSDFRSRSLADTEKTISSLSSVLELKNSMDPNRHHKNSIHFGFLSVALEGLEMPQNLDENLFTLTQKMGCNGWNVCIVRVTKLNTDLGSKGACMSGQVKKGLKASLEMLVHSLFNKNFPHTNELLEYDQHLKCLFENSFCSF